MKSQIPTPKLICALLVLWTGIVALPAAHADIYAWTDADGVRHFSNKPPRDRVDGARQSEEIPYDAAGDRRNQEADERYFDQQALDNTARRLEQTERALKRSLERAREAEARADEATPRYDDDYDGEPDYGVTYYVGGYGGEYYRNERGRRGDRDHRHRRRHRRMHDEKGYRPKEARYDENSKDARLRRHRHISQHRRSKRERGVRSGLTRAVRALPSPYYMGYRPVYSHDGAYELRRGGNGHRAPRRGGGPRRSGGRGRILF